MVNIEWPSHIQNIDPWLDSDPIEWAKSIRCQC